MECFAPSGPENRVQRVWRAVWSEGLSLLPLLDLFQQAAPTPFARRDRGRIRQRLRPPARSQSGQISAHLTLTESHRGADLGLRLPVQIASGLLSLIVRDPEPRALRLAFFSHRYAAPCVCSFSWLLKYIAASSPFNIGLEGFPKPKTSYFTMLPESFNTQSTVPPSRSRSASSTLS
jgi:hypothetical protein